jgi:hypothetical protein
VLPSQVSESESQSAAKISFESYGRLLTLLLPRLRNFAVHDGFANCIWSSPDWNLDDSGEFVRETILAALRDAAETPALGRAIDNDRALYAFALRGDNHEVMAVVCLEVTIQANQREFRPVETLRPFVQPAIECLRRELALRNALGVRAGAPAPLPQAVARSAEPRRDGEVLDKILRNSFDYVGCALAALWIPEMNVSISLTPSGKRMSAELLRVAQRQLVESMQQKQRTIIVNKGSAPASTLAAAYKILACPIAYPSGRFAGVLALFNPPSVSDFHADQARCAELLAKCINAVINLGPDAILGAGEPAPMQNFG